MSRRWVKGNHRKGFPVSACCNLVRFWTLLGKVNHFIQGWNRGFTFLGHLSSNRKELELISWMTPVWIGRLIGQIHYYLWVRMNGWRLRMFCGKFSKWIFRWIHLIRDGDDDATEIVSVGTNLRTLKIGMWWSLEWLRFAWNYVRNENGVHWRSSPSAMDSHFKIWPAANYFPPKVDTVYPPISISFYLLLLSIQILTKCNFYHNLVIYLPIYWIFTDILTPILFFYCFLAFIPRHFI